MTGKDLARRLKQNDAPLVFDVRSAPEYRSGHIPGAVHLPFWGVLLYRNRLPATRETRLVVTCEHGPRAGLAAAQLRLLGYRRIESLDGHMARWRSHGLPTKT